MEATLTATSQTIAPTLDLQEAARDVWDVAIVGAGPSGGLAARELARRGASVLLIDKASFPRQKACGCCVNTAALGILRAVGLQMLTSQSGAKPLHKLLLIEGNRRASIALPPGVALSRKAFDAALIRQAIAAGASFLPQTTATLSDRTDRFRWLTLGRSEHRVRVAARVVLAASGLGGGVTQHGGGAETGKIHRQRIGVGAILDAAPPWVQGGTITMVCGAGGYIGLVQVEDGRLNVAAALDPAFVRSAKGPGPAAATLIAHAGLPQIHGLEEGLWRGTPRLTQYSSCLAQERLFVIGDAAGYIEPFTGEGIGWALWSGAAVGPIALEAIRQWTPALSDRWDATYRRQVGRRQWACRVTAAMLRRATLTRATIAMLSWAPWLAAPMIQYVSAPLPVHTN